MHLYQGTSEQFIADAVQARLANQLADRFFEEFRYRPSPSEVTSWRNSLGAMAHVLQLADLTDQGILVELKLPLSSKRLDVLITGSNPTTGDAAVIVELKQWTEVGRSNITDCVAVDFGGRDVDHLHPSRQVAQYQRYLQDTHPAFTDGAIALDACAYLHYAQHDPKSPLYHADFATLLATNPSFAGDQLDAFTDFLEARVVGPDDGSHPRSRRHDRVPAAQAPARPRRPDDPQRAGLHAPRRTAGRLQRDHGFGPRRPARTSRRSRSSSPAGPAPGSRSSRSTSSPSCPRWASGPSTSPGSKAFTENLRKIVGTRASALFKYFRDTANVDEPLDVVILDEAHRIRTISTSRFTPAKARTGKAQIDDILDASRVSVFFIDDLQVVRPGEVGSTDLIREAAAKRSLEVREFELQAQFRSNGSDSFIQWVDNTLELDRTPQVLWPMDDDFDFRIVGSVGELDTADPRAGQRRAPPHGSSPASAGPGPTPTTHGELVPDVRVGDWSMPWNAKAEARRLGPGIPKSDFWASAPEGIDQVGCVYTAQGFEFDYVGVIFGPDLVYRPMDGGWVGQRDQSQRPRRPPRRHRPGVHRLRQEHLPRPADPRPPRLLRLLHGRADARLLPEPDRAALVTPLLRPRRRRARMVSATRDELLRLTHPSRTARRTSIDTRRGTMDFRSLAVPQAATTLFSPREVFAALPRKQQDTDTSAMSKAKSSTNGMRDDLRGHRDQDEYRCREDCRRPSHSPSIGQ